VVRSSGVADLYAFVNLLTHYRVERSSKLLVKRDHVTVVECYFCGSAVRRRTTAILLQAGLEV
jgi:hypothetical protein